MSERDKEGVLSWCRISLNSIDFHAFYNCLTASGTHIKATFVTFVTKKGRMATYIGVNPRDVQPQDLEMNSQKSGKTVISPMEANAMGSSFNSNKVPQDISWSKVNFTVKEKSILTDCWGRVGAGTVCALMGPSGAGKSSLLNVLAGIIHI